jgi:hypothetical protein
LTVTTIGIVALATPFLFTMFPVDRGASVDGVIIRNSLLGSVGDAADFEWTPDVIPPDFLQEERRAPQIFADAARRLFPDENGQGPVLERALTIAQHLASGPGRGDAIMSDTEQTYRTIIESGGGYCSDYTQVFNALAIASGLSVREWGISFDSFGAGHAFNEVYDPSVQKWILVDSFWSLYIRDTTTGEPLSALEFQAALQDDQGFASIRFIPIVENRFGFASALDAWTYYRRAKDQFFLWWGNNVWSYDAHPLVARIGPFSRSLEQLAAISVGIHPKLKIVPTAENQQAITSLFDIRFDLVMRVSALFLLSILFLVFAIALFREHREHREHLEAS